MKKYFLYNIMIVVLAAVVLAACSDDEESARTKQTKLLVGETPWTMQTLTVNGVNKTDLFTGLKLTFSNQTFSSQNGEPVWPASETWSFTDDNATSFKRGDDVEVHIETLTANTLVLKLLWDETTIGGRVRSVEGEHMFTFTR